MQEASSIPLSEGILPEPSVPAGRASARPAAAEGRWWLPYWQTATRAVLVFLALQLWVVQGYRVYGSCMEPNLCTGERLLGSKLALLQGIHRGDVVVFRPPHQPDTAYVKRVIGLPGEVIEIRHSRVFIDGRELKEPYLQRAWHDDRPPQRIGADRVFVLGDNRDNSNDSRMWGELPIRNISAKAWLRYWPPERIGWIR